MFNMDYMMSKLIEQAFVAIATGAGKLLNGEPITAEEREVLDRFVDSILKSVVKDEPNPFADILAQGGGQGPAWLMDNIEGDQESGPIASDDSGEPGAGGDVEPKDVG